MMRSAESSGREVTSTIAVSPLRNSSTPPRAPAGMPSTGSVSSTRSSVAIPEAADIDSILETWIGGDQPRGLAGSLVMPGRSHGRDARGDREFHLDAADDAVGPSVDDPVDRCVEHGEGDCLPQGLGRLPRRERPASIPGRDRARRESKPASPGSCMPRRHGAAARPPPAARVPRGSSARVSGSCRARYAVPGTAFDARAGAYEEEETPTRGVGRGRVERDGVGAGPQVGCPVLIAARDTSLM